MPACSPKRRASYEHDAIARAHDHRLAAREPRRGAPCGGALLLDASLRKHRRSSTIPCGRASGEAGLRGRPVCCVIGGPRRCGCPRPRSSGHRFLAPSAATVIGGPRRRGRADSGASAKPAAREARLLRHRRPPTPSEARLRRHRFPSWRRAWGTCHSAGDRFHPDGPLMEPRRVASPEPRYFSGGPRRQTRRSPRCRRRAWSHRYHRLANPRRTTPAAQVPCRLWRGRRRRPGRSSAPRIQRPAAFIPPAIRSRATTTCRRPAAAADRRRRCRR